MGLKKITPWLRIHLVGSNMEIKDELASTLKSKLRAKKGKHITIVSNLSSKIQEKYPVQDVSYFLALENEYMKYESEVKNKKIDFGRKNIIFTDSLVDRCVRAQHSDLPLDPYFSARLSSASQEPGYLFLYGPNFDNMRSDLIMKYKLTHQLWSNKEDCLNELIESIMLQLRNTRGKHS